MNDKAYCATRERMREELVLHLRHEAKRVGVLRSLESTRTAELLNAAADHLEKGRVAPPGRDVRGAKNPAHKLTRPDVSDIRNRKQRGWTHAALARHYGVSEGTIRNIITRRTWQEDGAS